MSYRGNDLDLKVAPGRVRSTSSSGDTTLWVDETVLACCNNAFDLALAYGAGEVRLAHLVHALTRVDAAVRILEQRSIAAARVRHESATLIVNESPVPLTSERQSPRRSIEFEEVLRRAVDMARRRGSSAGIEDVLNALLMGNRANPAVELMQRLAPELPPDVADEAVPAQRLDLIEDTLRSIHAELAGDRRLLSDIVRDLQREVAGQRGDSASFSTKLGERLGALERHLSNTPGIAQKLLSIEQAVHGGTDESARARSAIEQRLESLEAAVRAADPVELIANRLAAVEQTLQERTGDTTRSWAALLDRVQSLEKLYQAGSTETVRQWSALAQSNTEILKSLGQQQSAPVDSGVLTERLEVIEQIVRNGIDGTARSNALLAERVGGVERVISTRNDTQPLMLIDERLRTLETVLDGRARETGGRWGELIDRLKTIETRIGGIPDAPSAAVLTAVTNAAAARDEKQASAIAEIGGRVAALEHVVQANNAAVHAAARVYDRNADELHEGFVRLSENQHTLAAAIGDWRDDSTTELRRIACSLDRLKVVEDRIESLSRHFAVTPARAVPSPDEVYTPPQRLAPAATAGSSRETLARFRRWLFGTDNLGRANSNAQVSWQRMRDEVRAATDRLRKR